MPIPEPDATIYIRFRSRGSPLKLLKLLVGHGTNLEEGRFTIKRFAGRQKRSLSFVLPNWQAGWGQNVCNSTKSIRVPKTWI